jgi:hypothetical protein
MNGRHQANGAQQAARRTTGERPPCPQRIFWVLRSGAPWRDTGVLRLHSHFRFTFGLHVL